MNMMRMDGLQQTASLEARVREAQKASPPTKAERDAPPRAGKGKGGEVDAADGGDVMPRRARSRVP